jgi:hypothetical protein
MPFELTSHDAHIPRSIDPNGNSVSRNPIDGQDDVPPDDQLLTFFSTQNQHDLLP